MRNKTLWRLGIIDKISHCIAHNKFIDKSFDVAGYVDMCLDVMFDAGLPKQLALDIVKDACERADEQLLTLEIMGLPVTGHGGSQIHPAIVIGMECVRLAQIIAMEEASATKE